MIPAIEIDGREISRWMIGAALALTAHAGLAVALVHWKDEAEAAEPPAALVVEQFILGNIGHECGGFRLMQELRPTSGRGGFGWVQWTGPRRVAFEKFCDDNGLEPTSDAANYRFLKLELQTTEKATVPAMK